MCLIFSRWSWRSRMPTNERTAVVIGLWSDNGNTGNANMLPLEAAPALENRKVTRNFRTLRSTAEKPEEDFDHGKISAHRSVAGFVQTSSNEVFETTVWLLHVSCLMRLGCKPGASQISAGGSTVYDSGVEQLCFSEHHDVSRISLYARMGPQ